MCFAQVDYSQMITKKNQSVEKKDPVTLNELKNAVENVPVDEMASMLKKVIDSKYLVVLPDWVTLYPIPPNTVASIFSPAACWLKVNVLRKTMGVTQHPVHVVDELLVTSNVIVKGEKIAYRNSDNVMVELDNKRGFHVLDASKEALVVASAYVADNVAYYAKADANGSVTPTLSVEHNVRMGMLNVDTTASRAVLSKEIPSPNLARTSMYNHLMANPDQAFYLCNQICKQNKTYGVLSANAKAYYDKLVADNPALPPMKHVVLPMPRPQKVIRIIDMNMMYRFLNESRGYRGDNKGVGIITNGYIRGCTTRSNVKNETLFLDIRQAARAMSTNIIVLQGKLPVAVVRMLVVNCFFLVDSTMVSKNKLIAKDVDEKKYDVYFSVEKGIKYMIWYAMESVGPTVKSKSVEYVECHIENVFVGREKSSNCLGRACRLHLHPEMVNMHTFGFLPGALAHNAQVIVIYPKIKSVAIANLVARASEANTVRNNYAIIRRSWCLLDRYQSWCGYMDEYIIPKMVTRKKNERINYCAFAEDLEEAENDREAIDLVIDPRHIRPPPADVLIGLYANVYGLLISSNDIPNTVCSLFKQYGQNEAAAPLHQLFLRNIPEAGVINTLMDAYPASKALIAKGYDMLMQMRETLRKKQEEEALKPPPASEPPNDDENNGEELPPNEEKGGDDEAPDSDDDYNAFSAQDTDNFDVADNNMTYDPPPEKKEKKKDGKKK